MVTGRFLILAFAGIATELLLPSALLAREPGGGAFLGIAGGPAQGCSIYAEPGPAAPGKREGSSSCGVPPSTGVTSEVGRSPRSRTTSDVGSNSADVHTPISGAGTRQQPGSVAAPTGPTAVSDLYQRLGRFEGITQIANAFVDTLASDQKLLAANAALKAAAVKTDKADAKKRLANYICEAVGGPCHPKYALFDPKVISPKTKLGYWEWFYIARDANAALDRAGVGMKEKGELMALLWEQRGG